MLRTCKISIRRLSSVSLEQRLTQRLKQEFQPSSLTVLDVSGNLERSDKEGGCGQSFSLTIVSSKFKNQSLVHQHRMVTNAVKDLLPGIHALQIATEAE
jgi:stress-induced morphogen